MRHASCLIATDCAARWPALAAAVVVCTAAPLAQGQLADPTRPAAVAPARSAAAPDPAATRRVAPAASPLPRVQSVQVHADGSGSALIDGQLVQVGSRIGTWTVHAIDLEGVELRTDRARQRLALAGGAAIKHTPAAADLPGADEPRRRATASIDRKDPS
jgi:hypothetical protein